MKILKNTAKFTGVLIAIAGLTFFLGPQPEYPEITSTIPYVDLSLKELENRVALKEASIENLKENNHSRVIWADTVRKTDYVVVYLHGFSASPMEGYPVHVDFAQRYGCNLYIPRLKGHGLDDKDSFAELTPKDLIDSAREAIGIGQLLGEKVILMSCSTGSTLSIYLAAENPGVVDAMLMYSPNIDLYDGASDLLTKPWGLQMAHQILGEYRYVKQEGEPPLERDLYTTQVYRTEGLVSLKYLIAETMTEEVFQKINIPYFIAYYYKNEEEKDKIISIEEILNFAAHTSTPEDKKRIVPLANAKTHVVPSGLHNEDIAEVRQATYQYAEEILNLSPVQ